MGDIFSSPPPPPNPQQLATAQTGTNISTAIANAYLNNPNTYTWGGATINNVDSYYTVVDPTTGVSYQVPQFRQDQVLNDPNRQIMEQSTNAKLGLANLANEQTKFLQSYLATPFNPLTSAPAAGSASMLSAIPKAATTFGDPSFNVQSIAAAPTTFGNTSYSLASLPMAQKTFANTSFLLGSQPMAQKTFGETSDYNLARQHVEDALFQRLNPQLDRSRGNIEQRLADQGIRYGSTAYQNAMSDYNREANDLRLGVTMAGSAEQEQAYTQDLRRGQFYNAGLAQDMARQQQEYAQLLGRGQFFNQGLGLDIARQGQEYEQLFGRGQFAQQGLRDQLARQQQGFTQDYQRGQFSNAALAQQLNQAQSIYNATNADRANYLAEQYAQRSQPINEITGLLGGAQIQIPNMRNFAPSTIATTDIAGLYNTNFAQQQAQYNAQQQQIGQLVGGGLGALGSILSDKRAKKDIHRVGTVFAAKPQPIAEPETKQLPVYDYQYKGDPSGTRHIGPMAQDVEKIDPQAVETVHGFKRINAPRVMGSLLRAA